MDVDEETADSMNEKAYRSYRIIHTFSSDPEGEFWEIRRGERARQHGDAVALYRFEVPPETPDSERWACEPPLPVRQEYERLIDYHPGDRIRGTPNVVEFIADGNCSFDQPCAFGHRVEDHAVYCHSPTWLYAPRKCRRNRTDFVHEHCPGFNPNERFQGNTDP
jgi:hypothetical protein